MAKKSKKFAAPGIIIPNKAKATQAVLWEIAKKLAKQFEFKTLQGEPLRTAIGDDTVLVGTNGIPMPRDPDFIVAPDGAALLRIKLVEHQGQQMKAWVKVEGMTCPHCHTPHTFVGWDLEDHGLYPNRVVQCPSCYQYLWMRRGKTNAQPSAA